MRHAEGKISPNKLSWIPTQGSSIFEQISRISEKFISFHGIDENTSILNVCICEINILSS